MMIVWRLGRIMCQVGCKTSSVNQSALNNCYKRCSTWLNYMYATMFPLTLWG